MKPSVKVVKSFVKQVQKYPLHFLLISAIMFLSMEMKAKQAVIFILGCSRLGFCHCYNLHVISTVCVRTRA